MNPPPENFDALRRLLTLKRYEQPPPGYFDHFSVQVIARIRAGERGEPASLMARFLGQENWWNRLWAALESRPGFAGALGAAACALLISGIVYSESAPAPLVQAMVPDEPTTLLTTAAVTADGSFDQADLVSSTNPFVPPAESLFSQFQGPKVQVQTVDLMVPGN